MAAAPSEPRDAWNKRMGDNFSPDTSADGVICFESSPTPLSQRSTASSDSASLNELDEETINLDFQGISLLKQIFPEESTHELRQLHEGRLHRTTERNHDSPLGSRIRRRQQHYLHETETPPEDFLRLPAHVAVRRYSNEDGRWHYELVRDLETRALQHLRCFRSEGFESHDEYYTKVLFRDDKCGLGMILMEDMGLVRVHSLHNGDERGPASRAGILPGHVLIGINGNALLESVAPGERMLEHIVSQLKESPNPIVLHLLKTTVEDGQEALFEPPTLIATQSLLDTSDLLNDSQSVELPYNSHLPFPSTPFEDRPRSSEIHPFVRSMASSALLKHGKQEQHTSDLLHQFTERARQWEEAGSFTIPSKQQHFTFVPLVGVRKALSIRIVNSFQDRDEMAYTIWVYDVESGREWYAPVRYFRDFQDLRSATLPLLSSIAQLPFPKSVLSLFGSPVRAESSSEKENKCRQLESFLRSLSVLVYQEKLHPAMAEIAIHVQSFLGCDAVLGSIVVGEPTVGQKECAHETHVRLGLKRSIQRYVFRLFLLHPIKVTVEKFVKAVMSQGPRLQDIESLEAEGRSVLKGRAMKELSLVQEFLDQMQKMILHGCMEDFRMIAGREAYEEIYPLIFSSSDGGVYWDRLLREAVREQTEIEVYVPLRGVVSRWLVSGWKHEDMELQFKVRELCKRPEMHFRLAMNNSSRWESVASILKEGVGMSTLPCVKLRAIVDSASEINKIFAAKPEASEEEKAIGEHMGADEFLPIFIYCVVKAEMERPCALSLLLRTLCDPINRMGETGYYLASFEAAIAHLQEVDLSEQPDELQTSLISIPLDN